MSVFKRLTVFFALLCFGQTLSAQLEVDQLFARGFSAVGLGSMFHFGFPVLGGDEVSAEVGLNYFASNGNHAALAPCLLGYRHTLDGSGVGFYVESFAGYCFAGTDIVRTDSIAENYYNNAGIELDQKLGGLVEG